MEASGVVFRPLPCFPSGSGIDSRPCCSSSNSLFFGVHAGIGGGFSAELWPLGRCDSRVSSRPRMFPGFCDNSHLDYYSGPTTSAIRCGDRKKEKKSKAKKMKKSLKLLDGFSGDLTAFSDMGFGLNSDNDLVNQVKGKMISEAAELLLAQLHQLRAEQKELKRKKKEDKANLKAVQMQNKFDLVKASSSSSESSDSDSACGEVVDITHLKCKVLGKPVATELQPTVQEATPPLQSLPERKLNTADSQPVIGTWFSGGNKTRRADFDVHGLLKNLEGKCCNGSSSSSCSNAGNAAVSDHGKSLDTEGSRKKIEVCMGGKCKKSGAASLLEEFQRAVGVEDAVVGCKCMGKCKDGPNVRVLNSVYEVKADGVDDSFRIPINPLCIGVGLEDVSLIVANFLGGNREDLGLAAP